MLILVVVSALALMGHASSDAQTSKAAISEMQAGHFSAARELLSAQLARSPGAIELWNLLGISETELHRAKAAEEAFDHGLKIAPRNVSLNENAGLLWFREANYQKAKAYLARAVALGSGKAGVKFSLAAARLRTGEAALALRDLRQLEAALRDRSEYWEERGRAELGQSAVQAEISFNRALALDPQRLDALLGAASAAEKQGLDEKALAYLIRARAAAPNDVPMLLQFANVCIRRDLGPDALQALATAHLLEPANPDIWYLEARANISVENWQKAYDLFERFTKREPEFAPAYYAMGWLDVRLSRVADARRQLQHALRLEPGLTGARYELAQLDFDDGRLDLAERGFRAVLKAAPDDAKANTGLGDIVMRQGDLVTARKLFEKAVRENPKLAAAHYKLSVLLARQHEPAKAAAEKALAAELSVQEKRASKVQLRLALPNSGTGVSDVDAWN